MGKPAPPLPGYGWSVSAPTAGLHFTGEILDACRSAGAEIAHVTLHVGLGTFQPLHGETVEAATPLGRWGGADAIVRHGRRPTKGNSRI